MRLEVHHENGRKEVVQFDGDKAIVGSGENSNIIVEGQHIARNQIVLEKIDGKMYVTDLDNPNGTYINDQLIEPHKRIEFLSFFPIQIGPKILIYLLADEDPNSSVNNFFPSAKSSASSSQSSTPNTYEDDGQDVMKEIKSKEKVRAQKAALAAANPKATPVKSMSNTTLSAILFVAALAISFYFYHTKKQAEELENVNLAMLDPHEKFRAEIKDEKKNRYVQWLKRKKCESDMELNLCRLSGLPFEKNEGLMLDGNTAVIMYNIDRASVTRLQEELSSIIPPKRTLYFMLKLFTNQRLWMALEESGVTKLHLINLLIVQSDTTFQSELEMTSDQVLEAISLQDAATILHKLKNRQEVDSKEINLEAFKLKEL